VAGKRVSLGLKVTGATKARLDAAARQSGRTQSQEAEDRIEHSFDREDLLSEVLTIAYGKEVAAILMMLGEVIQTTGSWESRKFTSRNTNRGRQEHSWTHNAEALDTALQAAGLTLEAFRSEPAARPYSIRWRTQSVIEMVLGETEIPFEGPEDTFAERAKTIRSLLGPLTGRLRKITA
jgi:hypothetical protein